LAKAKTKDDHWKWKPGQSGNLNGRPTLPDDLKGLKERFTKDLVERTFIKYMNMPVIELQKMVDFKTNPNAALLPALDHIIIQVIAKAGLDGDQQRLGFLLDRTIGKVVDKTENHEYRINVNAHLDLIPKDKLIALLKDAESEGHVVDLGGENA